MQATAALSRLQQGKTSTVFSQPRRTASRTSLPLRRAVCKQTYGSVAGTHGSPQQARSFTEEEVAQFRQFSQLKNGPGQPSWAMPMEVLPHDIGFAQMDIVPEQSGLPMIIYVFLGYQGAAYGPVVRVSQNYGDNLKAKGWFRVTVEGSPRVIGNPGHISIDDLKLLSDFIRTNSAPLLQYWEEEGVMSDEDLLARMRRADNGEPCG